MAARIDLGAKASGSSIQLVASLVDWKRKIEVG